MQADDAVAALMDDPQAFLSFNQLTISGGRTLASGIRIFELNKRDGLAEFAAQGPGWSRLAKVARWQAQVTPDNSNRVLTHITRGATEYAEFRAYYIGMKQLGEGLETTHFALPAVGGPDLMIVSRGVV